MHRRFIGIAATVVALALGAAACSGGGGGGGDQLSHDQYQQKITQIAADFQTKEQDSLGSLQSIKTADDLAKAGGTLRKGADEIDNVANELDSLNPPDDAADANAKFVSGFQGTADALRQLADAADAKDFAKLQSVGQTFQNSQAAKDLQAADQELRKAGYQVPNSAP